MKLLINSWLSCSQELYTEPRQIMELDLPEAQLVASLFSLFPTFPKADVRAASQCQLGIESLLIKGLARHGVMGRNFMFPIRYDETENTKVIVWINRALRMGSGRGSTDYELSYTVEIED